MKKIYLFAALAAMLAACSENDLTAEKQVVQQNAEESAVEFSAYVNRGTTRAGWTGTLNVDALKGDANGFGVFGYYTNGELYSETALPDFMYNQQVTYDGGLWTYSPLKYWPNEFGTTAASEEIDRLTFFAYAPYVEVNSTTGVVKGDPISINASSGIVGMTRNSAAGDPLVKYVSNLDPQNSVDLCWGVADDAFTSTVDGAENEVEKNKPFYNVIKPKIGDRLKFNFKHALAQLNVQIDTDVDVVRHATSSLDGATKIWVRSVTFEGFTTKGALNLNSEWADDNSTPTWLDLSGSSRLDINPVTIYDGRRDGKEGLASAVAKSETPATLNPVIVQSVDYESASLTDGVTNDPVNLFNGIDKDQPVLVIPTGEPMKIIIVYDVETIDENLAGKLSDGTKHGSTIENAIEQTIKLSETEAMVLASGKKYTVKLHLGLTSVKFDATVTDWKDGTTADVDLPINELSSVANGSKISTTVKATETSFTFKITDLTTKPAVTSGSSLISSADIGDLEDGTSTVTLTLKSANNTVDNKTNSITLTADGKNTRVSIVQVAAPFIPSITYADADNQFVITAGTGSGTVTDAQWDAANISIEASTDGTSYFRLDKGATSVEGDYYVIGGLTGRVVARLNAAPSVTTYYKITTKVGDAAAVETPVPVTVTVP